MPDKLLSIVGGAFKDPRMPNLLVDRNGWLFVVDDATRTDEPMATFAFYPLGLKAYVLRDYGRSVPLQVTYCGEGIYVDDCGLRFALKDRGRTIPEYFEECQIPPPRVRAGVEVKWQHGRWEKFLKSRKGWVTA